MKKQIRILILLCIFSLNLYSQKEIKIGFIAPTMIGFTSLKGLENEHKLNWDLVCLGLEINNFLIDFTPSTSIFYYSKSEGYQTFGKTIHTGPNGGNYYINSNGNKIYVARGTQSSNYQMEIFNMYELKYNINNFGVSYKFIYKNLIYGPYIGVNIITSNIDELKDISENIIGLESNAYYQNDLSNIEKSKIVLGGIIGIKLDSFIDIYSKITNKNFSLNLIFKLYNE